MSSTYRIQNAMCYINNINKNLKLNLTHEERNSIDYLDLTILRKHNKLEVDIYRKPTTTVKTINFMSNHPIEQKTAVYRFHLTRMHSLPLDQNKKQKEWQTIQSIARNNNFPQHLLQNLNRQIHNKTDHTRNINEDNKRTWATFTYHSPQIRKVKIGIAFKATETLQQLIRPTTQNLKSDYEKSGIYKITCKTCHKSYMGQTSHILKMRFQEHTRYIKNNDPRSSYALHILKCRHEYGNINDTMTLLKQVNKPSLLLPYEQMFIHSLHQSNELIN
jgi:hypothetical protein